MDGWKTAWLTYTNMYPPAWQVAYDPPTSHNQ